MCHSVHVLQKQAESTVARDDSLEQTARHLNAQNPSILGSQESTPILQHSSSSVAEWFRQWTGDRKVDGSNPGVGSNRVPPLLGPLVVD